MTKEHSIPVSHRTVIEADPGYYSVEPVRSEASSKFSALTATPIVAWEIEALICPDCGDTEHSVIPICLEGPPAGKYTAIKQPNGWFCIQGECTLESQQELLNRFNEYEASSKTLHDLLKVKEA